jgi:hypothetical protein
VLTVSADSIIEFPNTRNPATTVVNSVDVHVGSRARVRRTSLGISEHELSNLLGLDRGALAAHEAGTERIRASLLLRIAKALDVRPDYFFRGYVEDWQVA